MSFGKKASKFLDPPKNALKPGKKKGNGKHIPEVGFLVPTKKLCDLRVVRWKTPFRIDRTSYQLPGHPLKNAENIQGV